MKYTYVAVCWHGETLYSHVKLLKVKYDSEGVKTPEELIGNTYLIEWGGEECLGRIDGIGSKRAMESLVLELSEKAAEQSFDAGNDLKVLPNEDKERPDDVENSSMDNVFSAEEITEALRHNVSEQAEGHDYRDDRILKLETELLAEKQKVVKLQRLLRKRPREEEINPETEALGNGICVPVSLLTMLKATLGSRPSVFLRRLMVESGVFTIEEIANSSVKGQKCRFLKQSRPALNPSKFLPLKDYVIAACSLKPNTLEMLKFEQKITGLCSDARKKIKSDTIADEDLQ